MVILVFSDSSVGKESTCTAGDPGSIPGLGRSAGEGIGYPLQYSWTSLVAQLVMNLSAVKETCSMPGLGRSPGEGKGYPLQYSGLENSMGCNLMGFPGGLVVKNLPANQEIQVRSLGGKSPEEGSGNPL